MHRQVAGIARGIAAGRTRVSGGIAARRERVAGALAALRSAAGGKLGLLRARAAAEPPGRRVVWLVVLLVLSMVPAAFNAARESSFTASIGIFPRSVEPYPPPSDPEYWRAFLRDPHLQQQMLVNMRVGPSQYQHAGFTRADGGLVVVSIPQPDAAYALALITKLGPQLAEASSRQLASQAARDAEDMRAQLRFGRLPADERQRVRRKLRAVERIARQSSHRAVLSPPTPPPRPDSWADRVADALPGEPPQRSSPAAAALAGLFVAVTLWLIGLVFAPPAPAPAAAVRAARRPRTAPQQPTIGLSRRAYTALLAVAAAAFVAIIMAVGSGLETFRLDEWYFLTDRQGSSFDVYFDPHNEHLSALPVAVFKGMFETVGLAPYWPYRLMVAALVVLIGVLVYFYAAPRIGRGWAFAPGILTMLIGQGAYDVFWPFQIGFNLSVACGVGMLICFDRRGARWDLIAAALVVIALLSSSIGLAVLAAAVVDVALTRGQRVVRAIRVLALPVGLYVAWWLHYQPPRSSEPAAPFDAVRLVFEVGGTALSALVAAPLGLRLPAALALFALVAFGFARAGGSRRALAVACSLPFAYWVLITIGRGSLGEFQLLDSRYILPGAVFVACALAEVFRGVTARAPVWVAALLAVAVFGATANNVRYLRNAANYDEDVRAEPARIHAAALFVAGEAGAVDPAFVLERPLFQAAVPARLLRAFHLWGPPVDDPDAAIVEAAPAHRAAADRVYFGARALRPVAAPRPPVTAACRVLPGPSSEVVVPERGLAVRAGGGPVTIALRRWGPSPLPRTSVPQPGWSELVPGDDGAATPVRAVIGGYRVRLCLL
jgi:hypothetical protein